MTSTTTPSKYEAQRQAVAAEAINDTTKANDLMIDDLLLLQQGVTDGQVPQVFVRTIGNVLAAGKEAMKSGEQPDINNLPTIGSASPTPLPIQGGQGQGVQLNAQERKVLQDLRNHVYKLDSTGRIEFPVTDPGDELKNDVASKLKEILNALGVQTTLSDWDKLADSVKDEGKKVADLNTQILSDLSQVTHLTRTHGETRLDFWNRIKQELAKLSSLNEAVEATRDKLHGLTSIDPNQGEGWKSYLGRMIDDLASQRGGRRGRH